MFIQADLSPIECYLLDGGGDSLFVWVGSECMYPAMALAVRVTRALVTAMINATTPQAVQSYGASVIGDFFKMPQGKMNVKYIKEHEEPVDFIQCFKNWKKMDTEIKVRIRAKNADVLFTPDSVPEDETHDSERGDDGRLLVDTAIAKQRYSETVEYKRNSTPPVIIPERKCEDFRGIALKSTPESSKAKPLSSLNQSPLTPVSLRSSYTPPGSSKRSPAEVETKTPEFVHLRTKLKNAHNSKTNRVSTNATGRVVGVDESPSMCCCFPFFRSKSKSQTDVLMRDSNSTDSSYMLYQTGDKKKALLL